MRQEPFTAVDMAKVLTPLRDAAADWIARGRFLAATRRDAGWALADWIAFGRAQGHLRGVKFPVLAGELGVPTQFLKDALRAATMFPADSRDNRVSIEHHAAVASLPADEARRLLEMAWGERLPVQAMREAVAKHRLETGERFADEDTDTSLWGPSGWLKLAASTLPAWKSLRRSASG
jgi:hypothetical protein